jgi:hypothetical protein
MPDPAFINVPLAKGCVLRLPVAQYLEGLKRGKAWKRRAQFEARTASQGKHARREGAHGEGR